MAVVPGCGLVEIQYAKGCEEFKECQSVSFPVRALCSAVFEFRERRLGSQLRSANQVGARYAVIIGPDEVGTQQVRIRDMSSGDERLVAVEQLTRALTDGA